MTQKALVLFDASRAHMLSISGEDFLHKLMMALNNPNSNQQIDHHEKPLASVIWRGEGDQLPVHKSHFKDSLLNIIKCVSEAKAAYVDLLKNLEQVEKTVNMSGSRRETFINEKRMATGQVTFLHQLHKDLSALI